MIWQSPETAPRDGSHFIGRILEIGDDDRRTPNVIQAKEVWFSSEPGPFGDGPTWRSGGYGHDRRLGSETYGEGCLLGWVPMPPEQTAETTRRE